VVRNPLRWQSHCDLHKLNNRPYFKTHKLVALAKLQLELGAKGICLLKLGEGEVMANAALPINSSRLMFLVRRRSLGLQP
jgi:D-serine deaminase-like pyridoxal phosphate-dependent protein